MIQLPVRLLLTATAVLLALPADARNLEVLSRLDRVTVYPDGANVVRLVPFELSPGETTLVARDFPLSLDPQSIRVEGSGTAALSVLGVSTRALQVEDRPAGADALQAKLDALRLERQGLTSRIEALEARKRFAERYAKEVPFGPGEKEARLPFPDWRQAFAGLSEEIEATGKALIEVREKAGKLDRDMARLEQDLNAKPATRLEVRIDVAADTAVKGTLAVAYTVKGARWTPLYDARLAAGKPGAKPSLELVRRAAIVQTSGEDWTEVALGVSTVRTAGGAKAPDTLPLVVRFKAPPRPVAMTAPMSKHLETFEAARAPTPQAEPAPAAEQEAVAEEGALQVVWQVQGRVSVGSGDGGRVLRLASTKVEPELAVKVAAAIDATPYLEASFRHAEEAPLLPGRVALYRDGVFVGEGRLPAVTHDEPVALGFGTDERVKVTRTVLRRKEGQSGIVSQSKTERQEMKIVVRNGHDAPVRITVEDRIPQSEAQDIQVEMLPNGTPPTARDVADKRGVLAWSYDYAPGETRDIRFGWRLKWPADRQIVTETGR
jgi:uncharacterized protein (TIGR02231 family)